MKNSGVCIRLFLRSFTPGINQLEKGDNGKPPLILTMESNKNTNRPPTKRKISPTDIIMMLLGIFLLLRTPWGDMNSFYFLLFFLYIFCIMMRISNLRKQYARREAAQRKQESENTSTEVAVQSDVIETPEALDANTVVTDGTVAETEDSSAKI